MARRVDIGVPQAPPPGLAPPEVIVDTALDAVVTMDERGLITSWNRRAVEMFGWSRDEAVGRTMSGTIIPPRYRQAHERGLRHFLETGEGPVLGQVIEGLGALRRDGSEFPVEIAISPAARSGKQATFIAFVRDVTERARAERLRSVRFEVTRALAESSTWAVAAPRVLHSLCEGLGWELGAAWELDVGEDVLRWRHGWPEGTAELAQFVTASQTTTFARGVGLPGRVLSTAEPASISDVSADHNFPRAVIAETVGLHGGVGFPILVGGGVTGVLELFSREVRCLEPDVLGVMADVGSQIGQFTELRSAEAALAATAAELDRRARALERSNGDLAQFAYVASHDLAEPLRMVSTYVQLLADRYRGRLDADADDFIGFAVDGATRMQTLIDDLLTYSRAGADHLIVGPVECPGVVRQVVALLAGRVEETGAVVVVDPLPVVAGDPIELTQVFQNLLANALKFVGDRPPAVRVAAERARGAWCFSVTDNGIGIEPQHRQRIFDMFQRLHSRQAYPGTGIGLAICKKIIEGRGGRLWVDDAPGGGSTFAFTYPDPGETA